MSREQFKFVEIVCDGKYNRADIQEMPEDYHLYDIDYFGQPEAYDSYTSVFYHSQEFYDHVKDTGRVRGYKGRVWTDFLVWDFDSTDLVAAQNEVKEFIAKLISDYDFQLSNLRLFYSGRKGFHVIYHSPELEVFAKTDMQPIIKKLCLTLAEGCQFVDDSIYDRTRIFRAINSMHPSTGRYKIELPLYHIDPDDIIEMAKTQQECPQFNPTTEKDNTIIKHFKDIMELVVEIKSSQKITSDDIEDIIKYGFNKGKRNQECTIVAGMLHNRGFTDNFVRAIVDNINDRSKEPLNDSEVSSVISSVNNYNVSSEYVSPEEDDIITMQEASDEWLKLMELSGEFSFGPRYSHMNEIMNVTLIGDLIGIVGSSGTCKTTNGLDLLNSYATEHKCSSLFLSLEMARQSVFFKSSSISYQPDEMGNIDSKELAYAMIHDEELRRHMAEEWRRVYVVDRGLNIEQIEQYIQLAKREIPDLRMVGIDYTQFIDGMTDITKSMSIVRQLKHVMKRRQVIGLELIQTNKMIGNAYTEPEDIHLEGAQALKQSLDYLMGVWRSSDDIHRLHCKFMKTRWSNEGKKFDLVREGLRFHTEDYLKDTNKNEL